MSRTLRKANKTTCTRNFDPAKPRDRKLTEKGKSYQENIRDTKRKQSYIKLKRRIEKIGTSIESVCIPATLEAERDILDLDKEEFNEACRAYEEVLDSPVVKEEAYRWFDVRDREYTECRMRLTNHLQALERKLHDARSVKSSRSGKTRSTAPSRVSSTRSRLLETSSKAAKLEVEMQFIAQEAEVRRLQLEKEIALARAEEKAIKKIMEQDSDHVQSKPTNIPEKETNNPDGGEIKQESKHAIDNLPVKAESFGIDPNAAPFAPKPGFQVPVLPKQQKDKSLEVDGTDLRELLALQTKQAELSALIVDQQKMSSLPAQEPPIFSGSYFDYPSFISAFDAIISSRVSSEKDKLYFLSKYTSGKAHDVVKNFLTLNSDNGYEEARKLLANRYGNPVRVAEDYKVKLRNWPPIMDGDCYGLQELSDFLIRCESAMKSLRYMEELNSTKTLQEISAKLPPYLGNKWCRHARDTQKKSDHGVSFHHLVEFIKEEAELATDPIFSPGCLKKERMRTTEGNRSKPKRPREPDANTFASYSERRPPTSNREKHSKGKKDERRSSSCTICGGGHRSDTCSQLKERHIDERLEVIKHKVLCFGCL